MVCSHFWCLGDESGKRRWWFGQAVCSSIDSSLPVGALLRWLGCSGLGDGAERLPGGVSGDREHECRGVKFIHRCGSLSLEG